MTILHKHPMTAGRLLRSVGVAAILGGLAVPAQSADFWMSRVTIVDGGKTRSMTAAQFALESPLMATSATAVFDLSISLEEDPQGDDKYPEDPGAADADQNAYEAKIEEFADAVYQATNGAHKIGKVTVFRDGDLAGVADVTWEKDCASGDGPWAYPSTFGVAGGIIHMCTNWSGAGTLMNTPKGGGFTLAHEWMHYAYGVYDEYSAASCTNPVVADCGPQPLATDTASTPSIMNNQWAAARSSGADADFLEFSTSNIAPFGTNTGTNAQDRVFGESAWETLTRSPTTDPRHSYLPTRTQYTTLTAPTTPNWVVNNSETTARSELDVIWAGDQVVELMIDTSGSMNGTPMANAKTAGSLLVGQLTDGQTAVGVGRFTGSASQAYAITDIPDPDTGVKAAAQAVIGGFTAGGSTDIQGAALLALNETQAFQGGSRPSVVYLLTDGQSSVNVAAVTGPYTAAKVPLITFGFGSGVNASLLTSLATGTGGAYFNSPTTLAEIQQAFIVANAAFSSNVVVSSATASAAASATSNRTVTLDGTLATAVVNVTYPGPTADVTLRLLKPDGTDSGLTFTCEGTTEISCTTTVDVATMGSGDYAVEITNAIATAKDVAILVSASPSVFAPYDIAVNFDDANYPQSFAIQATVSQGQPLSGLSVNAAVTKPDATVMSMALLDDGVGSDLIADDGVYSADVPYSSNGTYSALVTASNAAGNAQTSVTGIAISVGEDGNAVIPTPQSVPEKFVRTGGATAQVSSFALDDHDNDPTIPAACTGFSDDNTDTVGRIDFAADVDCLFFTPTSTSSDLVVRLTGLTAGMTPVVKVYDATGATELASVDLSSSDNASSGAVVTVPSSKLDAAGHVVTIAHSDATATTGNYALSAGAVLVSDKPAEIGTGGGGGGTSGGGLGPWSLLFAGFFALIGLRQRRRAQ